jgi:hypothetical protein
LQLVTHICKKWKHVTLSANFSVDGEIYIARGDGKGSDGMNTYEMVHLRPLPNPDPSQPTSYIIEPVQCAVTGSSTSYVLQQTSQEQGAKLVKVSPGSGAVRQVMQTGDDSSSQVSSFTVLRSIHSFTVLSVFSII